MSVRVSFILASLLGCCGFALLVSEFVIADQAALLASIALFAMAVGVYTIGAMPAPTMANDVWERIRFGQIFIALIYASIAVLCVAAMLHAPDCGRFVHVLKAI